MLETAKSNGSSDEKVKQLEDELEAAQSQVQELTDKINEPITIEPVVIEKIPEDVTVELNELREKAKVLEKQVSQSKDSIIKFKVYFESVKTEFINLLSTLAEIEDEDPDNYEKYKNAVVGLMGKMSEKL